MRVTVGGFVGGDIKDPYFKELLVRWFAWGCFCPYIRECMRQASLTGAPVMRPLFFDFNEDEMAWKTEDEYMFGPDILVAPVMEEKVTERSVYLPAGAAWTDANTGEIYRGVQRVVVPSPPDIIPVFFRDGKKYDIYQ